MTSPYPFDAFVDKKLKQAEAGINDALASIPSPAFEDAVVFRLLDKVREVISGEDLAGILTRYIDEVCNTEVSDDDDDDEIVA